MRERQAPVANQWVILHRVGHDRAGPLDSVRTTAAGAFSFQYRVTGDSDAVYFVSTSYGGVAYYTPPLRGPVVRGDDAALVVFDTTSGPVNSTSAVVIWSSVRLPPVDNVRSAKSSTSRTTAR
jgi:hypothetical protein